MRGPGQQKRMEAATPRSGGNWVSPAADPSRPAAQRPADIAASGARNAAFGSIAAESLGANAAAKALNAVGKVALPLTAVVSGGAGLYQGFQRFQKDGLRGAAEGAFWGAADSISLGLVTWAAGRNADGTRVAGKAEGGARQMASIGPGRSASGPKQSSVTKAFNVADARYADAHEADAGAQQMQEQQSGVSGGRGFQNAKNQAAAQRAKGNQYSGPEE